MCSRRPRSRIRRISLHVVNLDEMEAGLKARLEALPPAARAELLHVLRLPDFDRVDAMGTFWGHPETRTFGELLIDLEGGQGGDECRASAGDSDLALLPPTCESNGERPVLRRRRRVDSGQRGR
jgi:hypothetical protein